MGWELVAGELRKKIRGEIRLNESLKNHTTWKIGGPADLLVMPAVLDDVPVLLDFAWKKGLPLRVLGNGSNILVSDRGVRGLVLKLSGKPSAIRIQGEQMTVDAGTMLPHAARKACFYGLTGLESMVGIPGTVGGALVMNAGANGHGMDRVVKSLELLHLDGTYERLTASELAFGYRTSSLQDKPLVVLRAVLQLSRGNPSWIKKEMEKNLQWRRERQPLNWPSAGSVFINPKGHAAGYLIEASGGKGLRRGGAQVSEKHANFIINLGQATARDVLCLIDEIKELVFRFCGIELKTEIRFFGEEM
ncbi:MAG: UDP-N-acetylmuramate dehydrogenase [Clostridia bacterium]|jgi:UDP-N-acetylmuramate dehydrogenase|nr:UDP-N-acetylmuramate dehydrogenase [Clostridia bacterium]